MIIIFDSRNHEAYEDLFLTSWPGEGAVRAQPLKVPYMRVYTCIYIYIYIYRERERDT